MRHRIVLLAALTCALSFAVAAAPAGAEAVPTSLGALFAELSGGCADGATAALGGEAAGANFLTGCTAQNDCTWHGGAPISCQGSGSFGSSCSVGVCSVTCDSQTTYCCDITGLPCPHRACVYCWCIAEGIHSPSECSDQACNLDPD